MEDTLMSVVADTARETANISDSSAIDANFIVMIVVLIIWIGIFFYLVSLDRKVKRLERKDED